MTSTAPSSSDCPRCCLLFPGRAHSIHQHLNATDPNHPADPLRRHHRHLQKYNYPQPAPLYC
ncbi:hypothetical protein BX661DRAFT_180031 [Kickxella alabastrina]|uniref:uncharacterized protein n=1 Tax=Kickxella alabastrina TaxID=61397 RepID=UPI00221EE7CA|nr:uncharacterized protein BX661DRAFT_192178 [Kickxella alabastrina]XP_051388419.1 uncharacterized protein BX661DRAFT_191400 [Kickxella alabastrina]XP_051389333.1 uncharacterized protein BX661DRAFT_187284 [Kickxella alabastrina]XP_051392612.1 uncharacterized protein BX661DRAFT_180031 [Kickxella alabastrina]KAI7818006.1 hypothetical protein BX661DRAFT_192178 [Kickxella alabastrina]KAI7818613.1 hypothetical protein BX661DRAFT_191400 [Kickxella alabastrina]KAI7822414.1 hypothetical protein BX661